MTFLTIFIYILATWRVASLFVKEKGPGDIFLHIREMAGIQHDEDKEIFMVPDGFLPGLLSCIWCASLWVAGFWILLDWALPFAAIRLASIFAVSAGAIWVEKQV